MAEEGEPQFVLPEDAQLGSEAGEGEGTSEPPAGVDRITVQPNAFGPGTERVLLDGEPLGVVLDRDLPSASAETVEKLLVSLAAPEKVISDYTRRRRQRDEAEAEADKHPAWSGFVKIEEERSKKLTTLRQAFIDAYKKKERK